MPTLKPYTLPSRSKASRKSQNLSKSMPLPTLSAERKINNEMATMYIANRAFSG